MQNFRQEITGEHQPLLKNLLRREVHPLQWLLCLRKSRKAGQLNPIQKLKDRHLETLQVKEAEEGRYPAFRVYQVTI